MNNILYMLFLDNYTDTLDYNIYDLYSSDDILTMAQRIVRADLIVDRTDLINYYSPYKISNSTGIDGIKFSNGKCEYTNIADICCLTSDYYIQKAKTNNNKIAVFYSGGIDSTAMTISFLKNKNINLNDFLIVLSNESIEENPYFFTTFIKNKCNYLLYDTNKYRELINNMIDKKYIFISGANGDEIFGNRFIQKYPQFFEMLWQDALPYIYQICLQNKNSKYINTLAEYHIEIYKKYFKNIGIDFIRTVNDFTWVLAFMFRWNWVRLEQILRSGNNTFLQQHFTFFSNKYFQHYAIYRHKIQKDICNPFINTRDYKHELKEYIFNYDNNSEYLENKGKISSCVESINEHNKNEFFVYSNTGIQSYFINNDKVKSKYFHLFEILKHLSKYKK